MWCELNTQSIAWCTVHCSTRYARSIKHNKHTYTNQKAATYQDSRYNHEVHRKQTSSMDAKPTQHTETTYPYNISFKMASSHPHYLTCTMQNYHQTEYRFRSCLTHIITITSTHTSTSATKKYIQPYLQEVCAWTKHNNFTLNPYETTYTLSLQTLLNIGAIWRLT